MDSWASPTNSDLNSGQSPMPTPPTSATCKCCITYGTFDLFHDGHRRILQRARSFGSHLIVAVTTDTYNTARGKLNVRQSLMERIKAVQDSGLADEIIIEEYDGQKMQDVQKLKVDVFVIGSDWAGCFDYLRKYCEVIYLERTAGISSTQLRGELRLGVVGCGHIAKRFIQEARFVSGVTIEAVCSRSGESARALAKAARIPHAFDSFEELLEGVHAVYIASPHLTHAPYALKALSAGKHVLCEKPLSFSKLQAEELYQLASSKNLVLLEAIKTAFLPGFQRMIAVAQSGTIGKLCSVSAACTMLRQPNGREYDISQAGGSITELSSYPLLAIAKIFGRKEIACFSSKSILSTQGGVDSFSRIEIVFKNAIGTAAVGIGIKAEGDLVIAGTEGYVYVPAPWWLMRSFEIRFEDPLKRQTFHVPVEGDGLRYELAEFVKLISAGKCESCHLTARESSFIADCIERARAESINIGVISRSDKLA